MELELKDTIELMNSEDYKDRLIAEYWQTKIRYEKLNIFIARIEAARISEIEELKQDYHYNLLKSQLFFMEIYLRVLEIRADIEGIDVTSYPWKKE